MDWVLRLTKVYSMVFSPGDIAKQSKQVEADLGLDSIIVTTCTIPLALLSLSFFINKMRENKFCPLGLL